MPTTSRPPIPNSPRDGARSRPCSDARLVRPASQADIARTRGVARSTVSRAVRPGGALHAAVIAGTDRIDAGHPACLAWIGPEGVRELGFVHVPDSGCGGCGALAGPYAGTSIEEFAARAEVSPDIVRAALPRELASAMLDNGCLDIGHPSALAFLSRYPLSFDAHDDPLDPVIDGHDFVCAGCIDENRHDATHPVFRAFLARYFGRVPTAEDAAAFPSP